MKKKKILKVVSLMTAATACVAAGAFALNVSTAKAETEDVFHELGASVRVSTDKGIRFAFGLPADKTGEGYEIGTLVIPKEILGEAELNHNSDTVDAEVVDYQIIPCNKKWVDKSLIKSETKDGYNYYNAALTDIPELNYNTVLVARSYYKDSEGNYVYSDSVERSIGYVASAALNDGYEDTKNILADIVKAGYGETALTVNAEEDLISVAETASITATNDKGYLPVWSSSNEGVATVDKAGKVTAIKGGETTITATIGSVTASKTVYVVGDGLYSNQFAVVAYGNGIANYLNVATDENGEIVINATYAGDQWWYPSLVLRKLESEAYYKKLIEEGYTKLTFNLGVDGASATELCVFDTSLSEFPQKDGVYTVTIDVQHIVDNYATIGVLGTGTEDLKARPSKFSSQMFLMCKATCNPARNYVFTISNPEFKIPTLAVDFAEGNTDLIEGGKTMTLIAVTNMGEVEWSSSNENVATVQNGVVTGVKSGVATITATVGELTASKTIYVKANALYSDQIGTRANGWNYTSNSEWFTITESNDTMSVAVKFNSNPQKLPMLMVRNLHSKAYYQRLVADEYTKIKFNLTVGGADAAEVSDLYVFGKALTSFPQNNGVYAIAIDAQHFVTYYDTMNTLATSGEAVGAKTSIAAMLLAWDFGNTWNTVRNYVFTISNPVFSNDALSSNQFGVVVNGWNQPTYITATENANEDIVLDVVFQDVTTGYSAVVFRNLESKAYYQGLIADGYKKLTFKLAISGADSDKIGGLWVFGTQLTTLAQDTNGAYIIDIDLQYIVDNYDGLSTAGLSVSAGKNTQYMLIAWKGVSNNWAKRYYTFTISNTTYSKA